MFHQDLSVKMVLHTACWMFYRQKRAALGAKASSIEAKIQSFIPKKSILVSHYLSIYLFIYGKEGIFFLLMASILLAVSVSRKGRSRFPRRQMSDEISPANRPVVGTTSCEIALMIPTARCNAMS